MDRAVETSDSLRAQKEQLEKSDENVLTNIFGGGETVDANTPIEDQKPIEIKEPDPTIKPVDKPDPEIFKVEEGKDSPFKAEICFWNFCFNRCFNFSWF